MRLFGHPIHPLLAHFPITCWSLATICDLLSLFGFEFLWHYSSVFLSIGLVLAIPTIIAGFIDFMGVSEDDSGKIM